MVDQATAKYLHDNIGQVLAKAMSDMAVQQPTDAVDFVSKWLKTYADQEELRKVCEEEETQVRRDREITQSNETEKAARREQKASSKQEIESKFQALLDELNDDSTKFRSSGDNNHWKALVDVVKQYMGAQSVYLGILDEEGLQDVEGPLIRYTHENVSAGAPSMLDKVLPKMRDAETQNLTYGALTESIPDEELAAKLIWKPAPPPQAPVPEGEEAPPPPEGPKYLPVNVPCVTDVPIVHYFEMPRLGAYLATPLVYQSYHTQDAFNEAKKFEEEKAEAARVAREKQEEREAQIKEAQEKGLEEPTFEEEEPVPEKVMELPGTTTKMVLCMDTLGTNSLFEESKYPKIMQLCDACAGCKARTEVIEVDAQALFHIGTERRAAAEDPESGLPKMRQDATEFPTVAEAKAQREAELNGMDLEPEKRQQYDDLLAKKLAFMSARAVVGFYKEHINNWYRSCFTVQPEILSALAAIFFLAGYKKEEVYPERKTVLKWNKFQALFEEMAGSTERAFEAFEKVDLEVGRKGLTTEQKLTAVQALVPGDLNEEKAKEIDPAFEVLWTFLTTAVDYRASVLAQYKADYEARKKQAEEQDPPVAFEEPELSTLDDDYDA